MCAYHPRETMNFHNDETRYYIQARIQKSNKPIRMDNVVEFSSRAFNYIAWPLGIEGQQRSDISTLKMAWLNLK